MVSADAMKEYISYTRCASYPDLPKFQPERDEIDSQWPAYVDDLSLSRVPAFSGTKCTLKDQNGKQNMKIDFNIRFPA